MLLLYEDVIGGPPDEGTGSEYWEAIGEPSFPVTADIDQASIESTTYDGLLMPGKCVVSDEMVLLYCYTGEDDTEALEAIVAHAAQ
jgi:hypothetical protein